jgi:transcriptional regulator with XRE-family HTH domain
MTLDTSSLPIGMALRVERTTARLSLSRIAAAVQVSIGQLSRIETGERTASPELIERIRRAIVEASR